MPHSDEVQSTDHRHFESGLGRSTNSPRDPQNGHGLSIGFASAAVRGVGVAGMAASPFGSSLTVTHRMAVAEIPISADHGP